MSLKASLYVWDQHYDEYVDKLVMLAIADFADDNGESFAARKTIAAKIPMPLNTLRGVLKRCEESGKLISHRNKGRETKFGRTNLWIIPGVAEWESNLPNDPVRKARLEAEEKARLDADKAAKKAAGASPAPTGTGAPQTEQQAFFDVVQAAYKGHEDINPRAGLDPAFAGKVASCLRGLPKFANNVTKKQPFTLDEARAFFMWTRDVGVKLSPTYLPGYTQLMMNFRADVDHDAYVNRAVVAEQARASRERQQREAEAEKAANAGKPRANITPEMLAELNAGIGLTPAERQRQGLA